MHLVNSNCRWSNSFSPNEMPWYFRCIIASSYENVPLCFELLIPAVILLLSKKKTETLMQHEIVEEQLQDLTQKLTNLETTDSLDTFLQYYDDHAISMPEYQLTLHGREEIKSFYREIFNRQNIVTFQRQTHEFIHMDNTIVEIGVFQKRIHRFQNRYA